MPLKALQVKGLAVKHLPKMDTLGKCDPFISVSFNRLEQKTKVTHDHVPNHSRFPSNDPIILCLLCWNLHNYGDQTIKSVFDAQYDEVFEFELEEDNLKAPGDMVVKVCNSCLPLFSPL